MSEAAAARGAAAARHPDMHSLIVGIVTCTPPPPYTHILTNEGQVLQSQALVFVPARKTICHTCQSQEFYWNDV